eukprot:TRINITY_DN23217_c0_g1_i1.p1 TRINITY_DN23217_c0_g1~~TRINITY_DN23217_c0_g1_i1.p1  ORF type:complete len:341 (-),score=53.10 TRINITY_DN23217_c0_g1_i1:52-1035(-)
MSGVVVKEAVALDFSAEQFYLAEGPYVVRRAGEWPGAVFSFVNIQKGPDEPGQLHIVDSSSWRHQVFDLPEPVGFAFPTDKENIFVMGLGKGLALYDTQTGQVERLVEDLKEGDTLVNDALLIDNGLVFGSKHLKTPQRIAGLWYYPYASRQLVHLLPNLKISNGMDTFTDNNGELWLVHTDSVDGVVKKFPFDPINGKVNHLKGEVIVDVRPLKVSPDGLTLSPDKKHLIVALWNDDEGAKYGEAHQYSMETGKLERIWRVPGAPRVTCPILVKDRVILTTAWEGSVRLKETQPNSGRLFIGDTKGDGYDFGNIQESKTFKLQAKL